MTYQNHTRSPTLKQRHKQSVHWKQYMLIANLFVQVNLYHLTDMYTHLNSLGTEIQLYALPQYKAGHYWTAAGILKQQDHRWLPTYRKLPLIGTGWVKWQTTHSGFCSPCTACLQWQWHKGLPCLGKLVHLASVRGDKKKTKTQKRATDHPA